MPLMLRTVTRLLLLQTHTYEEVKLAASRIANTQPTYDFITGNAAPTPTHVKPLGQSRRQSSVVKVGRFDDAVRGVWAYRHADIGNEDLRARIKTLQYEVESFKQERELATVRHEKELRDVQLKTEEIYRKAQVCNFLTLAHSFIDTRHFRQRRAIDMSLVTSMIP